MTDTAIKAALTAWDRWGGDVGVNRERAMRAAVWAALQVTRAEEAARERRKLERICAAVVAKWEADRLAEQRLAAEKGGEKP